MQEIQFLMLEPNINIKIHYVREALYDRVVELVDCPTEQMTADILTIALSCGRFETYKSTKFKSI